jgi:hypothetical protein
VLTSLAPVDEVFELCRLSREHKLCPRAVQTGLIELARNRLQFGDLPA